MAEDPNDTPNDADPADEVEAIDGDAAGDDGPDASADDAEVAEAETDADADADADAEPDGDAKADPTEAKAKSDRKAKADAVVASRTVTRRTVTSRRVTPKGGSAAAATDTGSKARDAKKTESVTARTPTPPSQQVYAKGPSPWWVPALMFALLIIGALVIMANYMIGDDASNVNLVIGLGFILGGIVTATQYR